MALWRWILREFYHVFPVFIFFLIGFSLINGTEHLLLRGTGITTVTFLQVLVGSALIAKVLLVIDHLPWIDLFQKKPLIFVSLWKTGIYWSISFLIRLSIRFFPYLSSGNEYWSEVKQFFLEMNWSFFAAIQSFSLMLFFIFVISRELILKIGPLKVRKMFFGF